MHTYLLVLLISLLASVFASIGDRKWLINMMLGLQDSDRFAPPTFNPSWTPADEDQSLSQANKWSSEDASDLRNNGDLYSIQGLNSDLRSEPSIEKKWPKHAKFHFSGFICCNQPPTPHPKTKRFKSQTDDSLRSVLLKGIAKSMARDRFLENSRLLGNDDDESGSLGNINYAEIDPTFVHLPFTEDSGDNGYLDPENQLFPNIQRRRVTVRSKRQLPKYKDDKARSQNRYGRKRSWDGLQSQFHLIPLLVFKTPWDLQNIDVNTNNERLRRGENTFREPFISIGGRRR